LTPIFSVEHRLRAKSGQWKWIRNWGKIVERDENGKPLRALGLHLDIDESKAVEEKLHRAEAQLAHAGRLSAMGEMVAGVAHEVNQPLYAIQNFSKASRNVLAAGDSPNLDDLRQWNDEIATAAAQAGEILDRLRNYARKSEPRRVCVCPCDLIGEAVELLAFEARQRQIAVDFERCETPLFAHADPLQIQEVLVNLMRNAYEATEEGDHGSPRITIRTRPAEEFVEISVADNGPGLRPMEQSNIFDPFVTTKPDGLGMGLAISRSIIEAHDGRLWADSNPEGGATFLFTLPVRNDGPDCRASAIRGRTDVD
jgi:two-component system sensor kinase FixL